jgi:FixJ family two-component response regulator
MSAQRDDRIFIIDDDPSVRKGLGRLLCSEGYAYESFPSAEIFLIRARYAGPCCIVLDIRMPGLNGLALQKALSAAGRDEQIIFITGHGDIPTCASAMKAGAIDFLTKPFRNEELLGAIARSLERSRRLFREDVERGEIQGLIDRLTPREHQVLELVIVGKLNKQIAAELGASEKTIKVHRGRVMQKMGLFSVAQLVRLTERVGIHPETGRDGTKV